MEKQITAEIEIEIKAKKQTFEMVLKECSDIDELEEGHLVMLNLRNGETYTGIFDGINDEDVILISVDNPESRIGLKAWWIRDYFEGPRVNQENLKSTL